MSYSGLFNGVYGENHSLIRNENATAGTGIARVVAKRMYSRGKLGAIMTALVGAAPGQNATSTHKRVAAARNLEENVQGGVREIETVTHVNRNTTAQDVTDVEAFLSQSSQPSYPTDPSGNTGGGKLGY